MSIELDRGQDWIDLDITDDDGKRWEGAVNWGIETDDRGCGFVFDNWYINFVEDTEKQKIDWDSLPSEVQVGIYKELDETLEERKGE